VRHIDGIPGPLQAAAEKVRDSFLVFHNEDSHCCQVTSDPVLLHLLHLELRLRMKTLLPFLSLSPLGFAQKTAVQLGADVRR
jgi:hypothetical protein